MLVLCELLARNVSKYCSCSVMFRLVAYLRSQTVKFRSAIFEEEYAVLSHKFRQY